MKDQSTIVNEASAYDLPAPSFDADLVSVVKGTPGGRASQAILAPDTSGRLGQGSPGVCARCWARELILFKTPRAVSGLVYPRCCHRGTALYYGKVEDLGVRCCYMRGREQALAPSTSETEEEERE